MKTPSVVAMLQVLVDECDSLNVKQVLDEALTKARMFDCTDIDQLNQDEIRRLIYRVEDGRSIIPVIKDYRRRTGATLHQAKELIDRYLTATYGEMHHNERWNVNE